MCTFFTLSACENNEVVVDTFCGDVVIVDSAVYDATTSSEFTITNVAVVGVCLTLEISASGCDGNSWEASLIGSENESLSIPPQRYLRLSLTNNEACLAVFQRNYAFDLQPILNNANETIILNLEGWNEPIIINP